MYLLERHIGAQKIDPHTNGKCLEICSTRGKLQPGGVWVELLCTLPYVLQRNLQDGEVGVTGEGFIA